MKLRRKIAAQDFTESMLPQTRREVFADVLKLHWYEFLILGFLLVVASLPILIMGILTDTYEAKLMELLNIEFTYGEIVYQVISFRTVTKFINIVLYMVFGAVLAGVMRVIRQYAWEEVVFFWRDLWKGIRQNAKQTVGLAFFVGLQNAVGFYMIGTGQLTGNAVFKTMGSIFYGLFFLLFLPVGAYMLVQICIYSNTFFQNLKCGFLLYAKGILKTLLNLVILGLVLMVSLLPWPVTHLVGRIAGMLLLPIGLLIWFLFVSAQLDKFVNPIHFPELLGRGMYQKIKDKTEKEELCD